MGSVVAVPRLQSTCSVVVAPRLQSTCSVVAVPRLQSTCSVVAVPRLQSTCSVAVAPRLQSTIVAAHGLSCSATCGIFRNRIEPVSPALADGFFIPEPPGKPCYRASLGESSVLLKWRATVQHFRDPSPVLEEPDGAVTLARGSAAVASACRSYQNGWLACLGPTGLLWAPELEGCPPFVS